MEVATKAGLTVYIYIYIYIYTVISRWCIEGLVVL